MSKSNEAAATNRRLDELVGLYIQTSERVEALSDGFQTNSPIQKMLKLDAATFKRLAQMYADVRAAADLPDDERKSENE